jgi:hypothetical protein
MSAPAGQHHRTVGVWISLTSSCVYLVAAAPSACMRAGGASRSGRALQGPAWLDFIARVKKTGTVPLLLAILSPNKLISSTRWSFESLNNRVPPQGVEHRLVVSRGRPAPS